MDLLLIFYTFLLILILLFPFLYLYKSEISTDYTNNQNFLLEKRKLLLANLQDLKADKDTNKLTEKEFVESSAEIIKQLEEIDLELKAKK